MKKRNGTKKEEKSLFYKEFFYPFLFSVAIVLTFTIAICLAVFYIFNDQHQLGFVLAGLTAFLAAYIIYQLFCVYWKVIKKVDKKLEEENLYLQKHLSYEKKTFTENIIYIIEDYTSANYRESSYQYLQKQAQFDALQNQINPHFLYNTLDSIRGKALEDGSTKTAEMLENLAIMFRYSISSSSDLVTLGTEIRNVESFFKIQQYRFKDQFAMEIKLDSAEEELLKVKIPKLTLQPIVENAINHGLDQIDHQGVITIKVMRTQSRIEISVADNGKGMTQVELDRLNENFLAENYGQPNYEASVGRGKGIALQNINARIKFYFGKHYGLTAYSTPQIGTEIVLSLPDLVIKHD